MRKITTSYIIAGLFGLLMGIVMATPSHMREASQLTYNMELMETLESHYSNVESLLDQMHREDETFLDTWEETDAWQEYLLTKEKADSLMSLASCPD